MPETQGTTKKGAATNDVPLESASPTGHEEIESQIIAEQMAEGDGAAPGVGGGEGPMAQPVPPTRVPDTDKPTVTGTETNPKHSDTEPSTPTRREGP